MASWTRNSTLGVTVVAALSATVGCSSARPNSARCELFATHMVALLSTTATHEEAVRRRAQALHGRLAASCRAQGTEAKVTCVLRQDTLTRVEMNCG